MRPRPGCRCRAAERRAARVSAQAKLCPSETTPWGYGGMILGHPAAPGDLPPPGMRPECSRVLRHRGVGSPPAGGAHAPGGSKRMAAVRGECAQERERDILQTSRWDSLLLTMGLSSKEYYCALMHGPGRFDQVKTWIGCWKSRHI